MAAAFTKVFGIGLNKTGTTTLGICFEILGFSHLGFRRDLLKAHRRGDLAAVFGAVDRYDTFEDWPYPLMYRELFERYGKSARFILTTRASPQIWLDSLKAHSLRTNPLSHSDPLVYGYDYPHGYEPEHIAFYEHHNSAVRAFFARRGGPDVLLEVCWELGHGWTELCAFLAVPAPALPFPHAYRGETLKPNPKFLQINQRNIAAQLAALERRRAKP